MRIQAGWALIVLGIGSATGALAEATSDSRTAALKEAAFAPKSTAPDDGLARVLERESFREGKPVRWESGEVRLSSRDQGPVDSLRVSVGGVLETPGGLPLNLARSAQLAGRDYEVAVIRNWPRAVSFDTERFDIGLSPHAGVGFSSAGGQAEAGAELRLESRDDKAAARLRAMGLKDGAMFGDQGRWYLFAAASGRAVGLNMLRSEGGWDRAGWTTDPSSALIGDAHVGVGYRKGPLQTSFGFIHREVKGSHMIFGQETKDDSLVAFSFSIKPRAR